MHSVSKKIVGGLFLLFLFFGAFAYQIPSAHAETCTNTQGQTYTADRCNISDPGTDFGYWIAQIVYVFTVGLGSVVVAFAAGFLSFTVGLSLDSAAYGLTFVSLGWTMLRDIANMAFIFILVYIAMKVMFEAHTAGTMGLLAKVLAVALVINFSFFATRVVIDAGNLISVQFYNAIVATHSSDTSAVIFRLPFGISEEISTPDITGSIMQGINFVSVIGPSTFTQSTADGTGFNNFVTSLITFSFLYIALGAALFMLAAAFITAGVKFIIRIVMLWMAIITAPLALVAWAFQGGGGHGAGGHGGGYFIQWRKNLISHAFYPAVFLFVLFLISQFMSAQGTAGLGGGLIQEAAAGVGSAGLGPILAAIINVGVRLAFVLVMLYFAIKAGDYFEVFGSKVAGQLGNTFSFGGLTGYRRGLDFVNNTVGPKRWAGGLDNQLKEGRLAGFGNTALGYRLRQAVTKPLSDLKLKDMESRPEYKERIDKENKEMGENLKHMTTHASGPAAEAKAQREFEKNYEGGRAGFNEHVGKMTGKLEEFKNESTRLAKESLQLSRESLQTMNDAQRAAYNERVRIHNDNVTKNKKDVKNTEDIIKTLKGMGSRLIEAKDKHHTQEIALKLMSSKNGIKYAVGKQVLMGKSTKDKLAEAARELTEEDGGGGAAPANHAAPAPHAANNNAAGGGAAPAGGAGHGHP